MKHRILLAVALACALCGCRTQSSMTAGATGCGTMSVDIVNSRYKRDGSTTVWCAKCKGKLYQCASNPDHSRVQCKEAAPDACE